MTSAYSERLQNISAYIYGTTRLGDDTLNFDSRVAMARQAMETGVWFHVSDQYGNALEVLAEAYAQQRDKIPPMIYKVEAESVGQVRDVIRRNIEPLGVASMEVGQLCLRDRVAEDFCPGSQAYDEFIKIRQEGLVKRYVMEVFPWTSQVALQALRNGCTEELIDGFIFYFNPLQRFAGNELWDLIQQMQIPFIGMRTVCGAHVKDLRDVPGVAWKDYLQQRAKQVAPVFEESGLASWSEFCVRFAYSFPLLRATVGSTATPERLVEFVEAAKTPQPLPANIVEKLTQLQSQWAATTDAEAAPWTL